MGLTWPSHCLNPTDFVMKGLPLIAHRRALFLLLSPVLFAGLTFAQQTAKPPAKPKPSRVDAMQKFLAIGKAPDPAAVERGKQKFVATCGFCHGTNANGGETGPDLIRSTLVLHDD